jgi:cytochrome c-type biogenesis protein CcmH
VRSLIAWTFALTLGWGVAQAIDFEGPLPNPEMQARFEKITNELRCLVCQNQTIADSNAELAQDLRAQTRQMLLDGATDEEVRTYMTERYGDFVLYRPPLNQKTMVLWFAPALLVVGGGLVMFAVVRRRSLAGDVPEEGEDPYAGLEKEDRT